MSQHIEGGAHLLSLAALPSPALNRARYPFAAGWTGECMENRTVPTGFEPTTSGSVGRRANRLRHGNSQGQVMAWLKTGRGVIEPETGQKPEIRTLKPYRNPHFSSDLHQNWYLGKL